MADARIASFHGLLNLHKPIGVTSRNIVNQVARELRKIKVGHAGTLDPIASGVLIVCVGSATRLIEYVQRMKKTYRATIRLGATSDTLDADGTIVESSDLPVPTSAQVRDALSTQVGTILQMPPQFSALKVQGVRAYELARAGREADLAPRTVTIYRIDLLSYECPFLAIEVECGGGTYIRSIARDLGDALGCGGLISSLTRTAIGPFTLTDAIDPNELSHEAIRSALLPSALAVPNLPSAEITQDDVGDIAQGRDIPFTGQDLEEIALFGTHSELVAIAEAKSGRLFPRRVLIQVAREDTVPSNAAPPIAAK